MDAFVRPAREVEKFGTWGLGDLGTMGVWDLGRGGGIGSGPGPVAWPKREAFGRRSVGPFGGRVGRDGGNGPSLTYGANGLVNRYVLKMGFIFWPRPG